MKEGDGNQRESAQQPQTGGLNAPELHPPRVNLRKMYRDEKKRFSDDSVIEQPQPVAYSEVAPDFDADAITEQIRGFIRAVSELDSSELEVSLKGLDPGERHGLESAVKAIEDAGFGPAN